MKDYNNVSWNDFVYYDEESPSCLKWVKDKQPSRYKHREIAGGVWSNGYYSLRINYIAYLCHRVVWVLHNGTIENNVVIDHIDGDPSNNRIDNLRAVTKRGNCQNQN